MSCTEWSCEMIKGYARVSTDGQDLATQHELLKAAGAELVYSEKQSGTKTDRAVVGAIAVDELVGRIRADEMMQASRLNVSLNGARCQLSTARNVNPRSRWHC